MFCPEGFTSVSSVFDLFLGHQFERYFEMVQRFYREDIETFPGQAIPLFYKLAPSDLLEGDMLCALGEEIFICSPDGRCLRLDVTRLGIEDPFDRFTLFDLRPAICQRPDLGPVLETFPQMYALFDYPPEYFSREFDAYVAQEENLYATPWDFVRRLGMSLQHHQIPLFYEREFHTITLKAHDLLMNTDLTGRDAFENGARVLRPFEGWAMCVKSDFAQSDELRRKVMEGSERAIAVRAKGGRPADMRRTMAAAYSRLYPDGHGNLSWLTVLDAVNRASGYAGSVDTLKRAIRHA